MKNSFQSAQIIISEAILVLFTLVLLTRSSLFAYVIMLLALINIGLKYVDLDKDMILDSLMFGLGVLLFIDAAMLYSALAGVLLSIFRTYIIVRDWKKESVPKQVKTVAVKVPDLKLDKPLPKVEVVDLEKPEPKAIDDFLKAKKITPVFKSKVVKPGNIKVKRRVKSEKKSPSVRRKKYKKETVKRKGSKRRPKKRNVSKTTVKRKKASKRRSSQKRKTAKKRTGSKKKDSKRRRTTKKTSRKKAASSRHSSKK